MNIGNIFAALVAAAKVDEEKALLPLIATAATSLAANPTALNFIAQGTSLMTAAIAAQPGIGQDVLRQLAGVINAEAQNILASAATPKT